MRFFADSFNSAPLRLKLGLLLCLLIPAAVMFAGLGGLVYLGYWLGHH